MHIALAQDAAPKIAELVEHEERMIALAAKMAVPCGAFLIPMSGADGTVHIKCDPLGRLRFVHRVNPLAREFRRRRAIMSRG